MMLLELMQDYQDTVDRFRTPEAATAFPVLVSHAEFALRAGVRMTLKEYHTLTLIERLAFTKAGDDLEAKAAQRIGVASQGLLGAALATQEIDDGETAEDLVFESLHARALASAVVGGSHG